MHGSSNLSGNRTRQIGQQMRGRSSPSPSTSTICSLGEEAAASRFDWGASASALVERSAKAPTSRPSSRWPRAPCALDQPATWSSGRTRQRDGVGSLVCGGEAAMRCAVKPSPAANAASGAALRALVARVALDLVALVVAARRPMRALGPWRGRRGRGCCCCCWRPV